MAPGQQKTCLIFILSHPGAPEKLSNLMKTHNFEEFWGSFFSFSSCWRMCCPAGAIGVAEGDPENIFGGVFWVKCNYEIFEPGHWKNTFKSIWILLHIQIKVGQPRTAVEQVFWHPTFDTQKMLNIWWKWWKKWVIPNRSRITLGMVLWLQDIKKHV